MIEDYDQYNNWKNGFVDRHTGINPNKRWFNSVQSAHKDLRNFIGGIRYSLDIEIKQNDQDSLPRNIREDFLDQIACEIGYELLESIFDEDPINVIGNTYATYNGRQVKVSKHIRTNTKREWGKDSPRLNIVDDLLSSLGQKIEQWQPKDRECTVEMYTSAKSFMMLGHYGCDTCSCFKQGGERQYDKINLGQTKNTFVLVIKDHNTEKKNDIRCWGFANADFSNFTVTNAYFNSGSHGVIRSALRKLLKEITSINYNSFDRCITNEEDSCNGVYLNFDDLTLTTQSIPPFILFDPYEVYESPETAEEESEFAEVM